MSYSLLLSLGVGGRLWARIIHDLPEEALSRSASEWGIFPRSQPPRCNKSTSNSVCSMWLNYYLCPYVGSNTCVWSVCILWPSCNSCSMEVEGWTHTVGFVFFRSLYMKYRRCSNCTWLSSRWCKAIICIDYCWLKKKSFQNATSLSPGAVDYQN